MRNWFRPISLILALVLLGGCRSTIYNLTPERLPENPSGMYTFTMEVRNLANRADEDRLAAYITIDGEQMRMERSARNSRVFEFDYRIPEGQNAVKYFYTLEYTLEEGGRSKEVILRSRDIHYTELTNRYVIALESDRGPVGAEIAMVGRNFTPQDSVVIGGKAVPAEYFSPNSIAFRVPPLPAGRTYDVILRSSQGDIFYGGFRVDPSTISATPNRLDITSGQSEMMIFTIPAEAPAGGIPLEVTTNVPDSVVMPPVVIPEGARSVNVPVEGGMPGDGILRVSAPGFETVEVPVSVQ